MSIEKNTKIKTILWLVLILILAFPIIWILISRAFSPYGMDIIVKNNNFIINEIHPLAPNRIERFGTDALGRNITTITAFSLWSGLKVVALAGIIRVFFVKITKKLINIRFQKKVTIIFIEILIFFFVTALPIFQKGDFKKVLLYFTLALGIYFFPLLTEEDEKGIFLLWLESFLEILVIFIVLGFMGRTIGANPYFIEGINTMTEPFIINQIAQYHIFSFEAYWIWFIPLSILLLFIVGGFLLYIPIYKNYKDYGIYFVNISRDFFDFMNPINFLRDLWNFKNNVLKNIGRLVLLFLIIFMVFLAKPKKDKVNINYSFIDYKNLENEIRRLENREAFILNRLEELSVNSLDGKFKLDDFIFAIRHGRSRIRPVTLIVEKNSDIDTFVANWLVFENIMENSKNNVFHQSLYLLVLDKYGDIEDLDIDSSIFLHWFDIEGEELYFDESLIYANSSLGAHIARVLKKSFRENGIIPLQSFFAKENNLAFLLKSKGISGIQIKGGKENLEEYIDGISKAILAFIGERQ